ncbi:NAD-dependent epimerase/dehydratase family protein [Leptolyngbya sp. AN03gr2]|uniref:NAD-dependent epimerase/dehydratase family protein n=1 Tax=unclassified Leptolyngbya TaxID=2650499 RepID=UPI003D317DC1
MNLQDKTLLITGIGGSIGLRTAELALAQGMKVRGLQRSADKAQKARDLGAEVLVGSINDPEAAKLACENVDIVLHAAAIVKETGNAEEFYSTNVHGTLTMATAAINAHVGTFVNLSSVMVYGMNYANGITEEGALYTGKNFYCRTKIEAEKLLLQLNNPPHFGVINIRPGDVYGPNATSWVVRPLQMMRSGKFVLVNGGCGVMNHVYIDNLIDGCFLAIEKQAYGETFNITDGAQTSWKDYYSRLATISNQPKPISMPAFLAKAAAKALNISPDTIGFTTRPYPYSIEKARQSLGYVPRITLDEGMSRTADWLRQTPLL